MLSSKFALGFRPDRALQALLPVSFVITTLAGLLIVSTVPLPAAARVAAGAAWLAGHAVALQRLRERWRGLLEIRFGRDLAWRALCQNGIWQTLTVLPGSRVCQRYVWLRLGNAEGRLFIVALAQRSVSREDWRRLQVILRCPPA